VLKKRNELLDSRRQLEKGMEVCFQDRNSQSQTTFHDSQGVWRLEGGRNCGQRENILVIKGTTSGEAACSP